MDTSTEASVPTGYKEVEKSALCRLGAQEIVSEEKMHEAILAAARECRAFMQVAEAWRKNPNPTWSRRHERRNVVALHFSRLAACFKGRGVSDGTAARLAELYQVVA